MLGRIAHSTCTQTHKNYNTHTHPYTLIYIHTHMHTHTHAYTHTCTHTHTHPYTKEYIMLQPEAPTNYRFRPRGKPKVNYQHGVSSPDNGVATSSLPTTVRLQPGDLPPQLDQQGNQSGKHSPSNVGTWLMYLHKTNIWITKQVTIRTENLFKIEPETSNSKLNSA